MDIGWRIDEADSAPKRKDLAVNTELELEKTSSLSDAAPVSPDANGRYPVAMPGRTKVA